jgi:hypothetical protein
MIIVWTFRHKFRLEYNDGGVIIQSRHTLSASCGVLFWWFIICTNILWQHLLNIFDYYQLPPLNYSMSAYHQNEYSFKVGDYLFFFPKMAICLCGNSIQSAKNCFLWLFGEENFEKKSVRKVVDVLQMCKDLS